MTFGPNGQTKKEAATQQLRALVAAKHAQVHSSIGAQSPGQVLVDSAIVYQSGETEIMCGEIMNENPDLKAAISWATKCNNTHAPHAAPV